MDWKDRNVLVLGLGDTGLSMTRWLARRGALLSVADSRLDPPHAVTLAAEHPGIHIAAGAFDDALFGHADAVAISPGIDRREPAVAAAIRRGVPVVGDIELFALALPQVAKAKTAKKPKVLAITGSNGKSTVTAMTGEACRAAKRTTVVAGNIGLPVLDALTAIESGAPMPDIFALELSSFQLESTSSLAADAATVLNVTEDHLDRYAGMADYAEAKARIFEGRGALVLNRLDAWSSGMVRKGRSMASFGLDAPRSERDWGLLDGSMLARGGEALMSVSELPVPGLHNAANALAALALAHAVGIPTAPMLEGLRRFRGLPHRLEKVAHVGGVTFYDDSKGTNVGATVAALTGMSVPVVLIAGGDGKGQDFSPLAPAVTERARAVVLIGRDAGEIARALERSGVPLLNAQDMAHAVESAYRASVEGDAVLLSPACASYDMFRSYVHRGEAFVQAVTALAAREEGASRE